MNIIVLYTTNIKNINEYTASLNRINCKTILFNVADDWENQNDLINAIKSNEHFFLILSKEMIKNSWVKFIIGYCIGKKCSLFIYLTDSNLKLPKYYENVNTGTSINEVIDYFSIQRKIWQKNLEIKKAKEVIIDHGLYLTPYHFFMSIEKDDIEAVTLFLKADQSPDIKNDTGVPAFNFAVRLSHNEIAALLMDHGCDINLISKDSGNNAVMEAAAGDNIEMIKILVEKKINLDVQSKNDQTALMLAVGRNNIEIVELLLQAGADTKIHDVLDMTAKRYAEILKYKKILKLLKEYE